MGNPKPMGRVSCTMQSRTPQNLPGSSEASTGPEMPTPMGIPIRTQVREPLAMGAHVGDGHLPWGYPASKASMAGPNGWRMDGSSTSKASHGRRETACPPPMEIPFRVHGGCHGGAVWPSLGQIRGNPAQNARPGEPGKGPCRTCPLSRFIGILRRLKAFPGLDRFSGFVHPMGEEGNAASRASYGARAIPFPIRGNSVPWAGSSGAMLMP
jgi:hypothetical protein